MDISEAAQLLRASKIDVGVEDDRDAIDIGVQLGIIGLRHCGNEPSGSFDRSDIASMRRAGLVVQTIAYGQAIYEAVAASELEV